MDRSRSPLWCNLAVKPATKPLNIKVKQIEAGDKLTGLSLGDADFTPLKTFVQRHAWSYERQSLARTYAAFDADTDKLKAYITLVCGEVEIAHGDAPPIDKEEGGYAYLQYPAVKIARLAVDKGLKGKGLGKQLVTMALGIAKGQICPAVGCRFMMVDSKAKSIEFYEKCGFTFLDTAGNRERDAPVMYIDLSKA